MVVTSNTDRASSTTNTTRDMGELVELCHLGRNSNGVNEPWFRGWRPLKGAWRLLVFTRRAPRSCGAVALQALCGSWDGGQAPAELFLSKPAKGCRTKYRRFATAAEALRFAVADLRVPKAFGAWLEVGDERFSSNEIQRLYEAADYPLRKPE